eukprot:6172037-Pleurochrysis_carterae.AAC.1
MADGVMIAEGVKKAATGTSGYSGWNVTVDDMLAFPQSGERSRYWDDTEGGLGPRRRISEFLRIGQDGFVRG